MTLQNGSPSDCPNGSPRQLVASFVCNPDIISPADDSWKVTNPHGTCNFKYEFPTCLACDEGCKPPAPVEEKCGATIDGVAYDFSPLKDMPLRVVDGDQTFDVHICGKSKIICPDDPYGVTEGMAVEKSASDCNVLGVFNDTKSPASWGKFYNRVNMTLSNGTPGAQGSCGPSPGLHRSVTISFVCDPSAKPTKDQPLNISNPFAPCEYIVELPTCLACDEGCEPPP